jgi:hypothetical protein
LRCAVLYCGVARCWADGLLMLAVLMLPCKR